MSTEVVEVVESTEHSCKLCNTHEYNQAEAILIRSGLQLKNWGFLLHDITSHLLGLGPYKVEIDKV